MLNCWFSIPVAGYLSFQEKEQINSPFPNLFATTPYCVQLGAGSLDQKELKLPENICHSHAARVQELILFMQFSFISRPLHQNPNAMQFVHRSTHGFGIIC